MDQKAEELIRTTVHTEYYQNDTNCAVVSLMCLCRLFDMKLPAEVRCAALGMFGAGGYRAQCGLVEGPLMFLGLYGSSCGKNREEIAELCFRFAEAFEEQFGSLRCRELRPGGFQESDPPHMCETLTCSAIAFSWAFCKEHFER